LLYTRRRYLHQDQLRAAIIDIADATFQKRLPHIWGEGTTTCASDSTHFGAWNQNLMTEMQNQRRHLGNKRTCHLFPFRLRLLILTFRGTLEALQGIIYAGSECFRAKCFEEPTPPAWGEDEVSAILDATGGRVDVIAGDVWFHLQAQWEKSLQAELVSFGIDLFDLEDEVQGAAKGFSPEGDGLADGGWTLWLTPFYLDIG
jgi:Tn3 transposase DDE domain